MDELRYSKHADRRMRQRARTPDDIEFVLKFGTDVEDGVLLSKQDAAEIERVARKTIELAHRLSGTYVAIGGDTIKTVFKASNSQVRFILKGRTKRHRSQDHRAACRRGIGRNSR